MKHTLGEFIERSQYMDSRKENYEGNRYHFRVDDGKLIARDRLVGEDVTPQPFSDWALQQLCQRLGGPVRLTSLNFPTVEALMKDADTREGISDSLTALMNKYRNTLYVRSYENRVRAVLTSQYAEVSNTELMIQTAKALEVFAQQTGITIDTVNFPVPHRSTMDEDELYLYVAVRSNLSPDGEGYSTGFAVRNSEVGRSALRIMPFVQRTSCENSFVFDSGQAYYAVHRGTGRHLLGEFIVAAGNALKLSYVNLNSLLDAREIEIPAMEEEIAKLAKEYKWSTEIVGAIGLGTEGSDTLFGLAGGITYAAHTIYPDDPEKRFELELLGGKLITEPHKVVGHAAWVPSPASH